MTSSEQFRVVCIYCLSLVGSGLVVFIFLTLVTVIRIEDEEGNYFIMNPEVLIKAGENLSHYYYYYGIKIPTRYSI